MASEFLLRAPKIRTGGLAELLRDSDSDDEDFVDEVLRKQATTTAPSWLRRINGHAPADQGTRQGGVEASISAAPSSKSLLHAGPSTATATAGKSSPIVPLVTASTTPTTSKGGASGSRGVSPTDAASPTPVALVASPKAGRSKSSAAATTVATQQAQQHQSQTPEDAPHGRISASLDWVPAATMVGHFRPMFSHALTPQPLRSPAFDASLYRNLGLTMTSLKADAAEARRMLNDQSREGNTSSAAAGGLESLSGTSRALFRPGGGGGAGGSSQGGLGVVFSDRLKAPQSRSGLIATPEPLRRASAASGSSPERAFHVPDLSAMDPYTVKEKAVVEAFERFRADPVGFALAESNKVFVTLPKVGCDVSGEGKGAATTSTRSPSPTQGRVSPRGPGACLVPILIGTMATAVRDAEEAVADGSLASMPAVPPTGPPLNGNPLSPPAMPLQLPLTLAREHLQALSDLLLALRAEAAVHAPGAAAAVTGAGASAPSPGNGGASTLGVPEDDGSGRSATTPLPPAVAQAGAAPVQSAYIVLPSLAVFVPDSVSHALLSASATELDPKAVKRAAAAAATGATAAVAPPANKNGAHPSATGAVAELPSLWLASPAVLLSALATFVEAYRLAVESQSVFMEKLLSPDLGNPQRAAATTAQLDTASRLLSSIHHAHSRMNMGQSGGVAVSSPLLQQRAHLAGVQVGPDGKLTYHSPMLVADITEEASVILSSHDDEEQNELDILEDSSVQGSPVERRITPGVSPATRQLLASNAPTFSQPSVTKGGATTTFLIPPAMAAAKQTTAGGRLGASQRRLSSSSSPLGNSCTTRRRSVSMSRIERATERRASLPRPAYNRGLCLAARDIAARIGNNQARIAVRDALSQFGQLTGDVAEFVVFGLKDPAVIVEEFVMKALADGNDRILLFPNKLYVGAGWQKHVVHGAVTVVLLATGFQEISYIRKHDNLPITELKRNMKKGQMSKDERLYDLNFIPEHYGIKALNPTAHPVVCGTTVVIILECPPSVTLACSTQEDSLPTRSQGNTFIDRQGRIARITAALTDCLPSKLVVYARHPHELVYMKASTILLRPVKSKWDGDAARATSFPVQHDVFQQLQGELISPRTGTLRVNDGGVVTGKPSTDEFTFCVKLSAAVSRVVLKSKFGSVPLERTGGPGMRQRSSSTIFASAGLKAYGSATPGDGSASHSLEQKAVAAASFVRSQVATFSVVHKPKPDAQLTLWVDDVCALDWTDRKSVV